MLAGVGVMVLMVPVNAVIAMKTKTYQVSLRQYMWLQTFFIIFTAPFLFLFNLEYQYFALKIPLEIDQISFFFILNWKKLGKRSLLQWKNNMCFK